MDDDERGAVNHEGQGGCLLPPSPAAGALRRPPPNPGKRKRVEDLTWFGCAKMGNVPQMRRLLFLGANLESVDPFGWTALDTSIHAGKHDAVLFLVGSGARLKDRHVCLAASKGKTDTVLSLLRSGAQRGPLEGFNPERLHKSAMDQAKDALRTKTYGQLAAVHEAQRRARGGDGAPAPRSDCILADARHTRRYGAYVLNARIFGPNHDKSPLMVAIERMEDGTVEKLLARGARVRGDGLMEEHGRDRETDLLHLLLDAVAHRVIFASDQAKEETRRRGEETAVSIAGRLLRAGAKVDILRRSRSTEVMRAVLHRLHSLAAVLARFGASIDRPDPSVDHQTVRQLVSDPLHPSLLPKQRVPAREGEEVRRAARLHSNMAKWRKAVRVVMVAGEGAQVRAAMRAYRPPGERSPSESGMMGDGGSGYACAALDWEERVESMPAASRSP